MSNRKPTRLDRFGAGLATAVLVGCLGACVWRFVSVIASGKDPVGIADLAVVSIGGFLSLIGGVVGAAIIFMAICLCVACPIYFAIGYIYWAFTGKTLEAPGDRAEDQL